MFTSKSISALVVVIFASTHLCLNRSTEGPILSPSAVVASEEVPNASILASSKLPSLQAEKSDHNFYLPNEASSSSEKPLNLSSEDAKASPLLSRRKRSASALKRPPVCLSLLTTLIPPSSSPSKFQCSVIQRAKKSTPKITQNVSSSPASASVAPPSTTPTSKVPKYNATAEDCDLPIKSTSKIGGNDPEITHPPQSEQGTSLFSPIYSV